MAGVRGGLRSAEDSKGHEEKNRNDIFWTAMSRNERLMKNAKLFISLRMKKNIYDKLKDVADHLESCADVNACDANDDNNTPLHIAVKNAEPDIVKLLLDYKPDVTIKNNKNQNPRELAKSLPENKNMKQIIEIIETYYCSQNTTENVTGYLEYTDEENVSYPKKPGTGTMAGPLHVTKLLSLILFRALHDKDIINYYLGTNTRGIGVFGKICVKYIFKNNSKPNIIFVDVKNSNDIKPTSPTSLLKCYESYKQIRKKFNETGTDDIMFKGAFDDVDCDFIIFTSLKNTLDIRFTTPALSLKNHLQKLLPTPSNTDGVFQISDINLFMDFYIKQQVISLAEIIKKRIILDNENNYTDMMSKGIIQRYHVVLAEKVINVSNEVKQEENTDEKYREGTFRTDFFDTTDVLLSTLREKVFEGMSSSSRSKFKENSFSFKIPTGFGNIDFVLKDNETSKLKVVVNNIMKLIKCANENSIIILNKSICAKIDLEEEFLDGNDGIAGLMGNLLQFDHKTKMFKFANPKVLKLNATNIYKELKKQIADENRLQQYRFDINIDSFPAVALECNEQDKYLAQEFLSKLWFFTKQPNQHEIGDILEREIASKVVKYSSLCKIIQPKVITSVFHDRVQKWWLEKTESKYNTSSCDYFDRSMKDILDSPMLTALNLLRTNSINKYRSTVNAEAVNSLGLKEFLTECHEKLFCITTSSTYLTMNKLAQFFENKSDGKYTFLDVDDVVDDEAYELVESEVQGETFSTLVFLHKNQNDIIQLCKILKTVCEKTLKKVIVVSESNISNEIRSYFDVKYILKKDEVFHPSIMCMTCGTNVATLFAVDPDVAVQLCAPP